MTREERKKAIEVLDDMKVKIDIPKAAKTQNDRNWALDVAIKALEQEPCDDAISREDARMSLTCEIKENMTITDYISMVDKRLRNLPSVTPSKRKGHWVHKGQGIYCSECGEESGYNPFGASRFSDCCPSCGVEMESEE